MEEKNKGNMPIQKSLCINLKAASFFIDSNFSNIYIPPKLTKSTIIVSWKIITVKRIILFKRDVLNYVLAIMNFEN
jgi:hypothetical protein